MNWPVTRLPGGSRFNYPEMNISCNRETKKDKEKERR